jgi:hypothetical protein
MTYCRGLKLSVSLGSKASRKAYINDLKVLVLAFLRIRKLYSIIKLASQQSLYMYLITYKYMIKSNKKILLFTVILLIAILLTATYLLIFSKKKIICNSFSDENCPNECVICPPCKACSSISCQTEEFCKDMGIDRDWYNNLLISDHYNSSTQ